MKNRVNVGTASILLIFIILCLSVFSLLSINDGTSALSFAERRAGSVTAYYEADSAGQLFLNRFFTHFSSTNSAEYALDAAKESLPAGSEAGFLDSGLLCCEIPMAAGQALHMEINPASSAVCAYYVYNKEDYVIDNRLPVWNGQ